MTDLLLKIIELCKHIRLDQYPTTDDIGGLLDWSLRHGNPWPADKVMVYRCRKLGPPITGRHIFYNHIRSHVGFDRYRIVIWRKSFLSSIGDIWTPHDFQIEKKNDLLALQNAVIDIKQEYIRQGAFDYFNIQETPTGSTFLNL